MREEDGCREGKRKRGEGVWGEAGKGGGWEYICGGQCCETRQVAVTLKMTVIKVTAGRWIWWFWLANQSSVKRTTAQIQRPPDTFWLMPVPDKKGPLTVLLLNWVKWQKILLYPTPALLISLSFKLSFLFYTLCPLLIGSFPTANVPCSSWSPYWTSGTGWNSVNHRGLLVFACVHVCAECHILYLSSVLPLKSIDQ